MIRWWNHDCRLLWITCKYVRCILEFIRFFVFFRFFYFIASFIFTTVRCFCYNGSRDRCIVILVFFAFALRGGRFGTWRNDVRATRWNNSIEKKKKMGKNGLQWKWKRTNAVNSLINNVLLTANFHRVCMSIDERMFAVCHRGTGESFCCIMGMLHQQPGIRIYWYVALLCTISNQIFVAF